MIAPNFLLHNFLIILFVLIAITSGLFILWVYFFIKKGHDVFQVTQRGIETKNNGLIQWEKIKVCSWEHYSQGSVLLIFKNFKRYQIYSASVNKSSANDDELRNFFDEIEHINCTLPMEKRVKMDEDIGGKFRTNVFLIKTFLIIIYFVIRKYFE